MIQLTIHPSGTVKAESHTVHGRERMFGAVYLIDAKGERLVLIVEDADYAHRLAGAINRCALDQPRHEPELTAAVASLGDRHNVIGEV